MIKNLTLIVILLNITTFIFTKDIKPTFELSEPGKDSVLDYRKYGTFKGLGTNNYNYIIKDKEKLAKDVGEGVYPNTAGVLNNKIFRKLRGADSLEGSHWNYVYTDNPMHDFYKWATAEEDPGVKQLFVANALKESGNIIQALKAYYAVLVHFPRNACYSADGSFVWYIAGTAIDKIYSLCRRYPELGLKLEGAHFKVTNGTDTNLANDIFEINPGKFVKISKTKPKPLDLTKEKIVETRGEGKVKLLKYKNGHWQMMVNNKPFIIKAFTYSPSKIGESPHKHNLRNWMFIDDNKNGIIDAPYEAWVDKNGNNKQDSNEKNIGDFQLLKEMGCNAIRIWHESKNLKYDGDKEFNKELLRDMYNKYGISAIITDFLGAYTNGSGAEWEKGTDYTDKKQLENMKNIVRDMVMDLKDEPFVLMWVLGNENNMPGDYTGVNATRTNASKYPKEYAKFLNDVAKMIHEIDPDHPVAVGNIGLPLIDYYAKFAPELDIIGINSYPDKDGFGGLWERVRELMDRPILITEYGCDAFDSRKMCMDEKKQALWHEGLWEDIEWNTATDPLGEGNSLGGIVFEWLDEWWKSHEASPFKHDKVKDCAMAFPDGWSSEEVLGIVSQGDGSDSPFLRQLRQSYFLYKKMWNK